MKCLNSANQAGNPDAVKAKRKPKGTSLKKSAGSKAEDQKAEK